MWLTVNGIMWLPQWLVFLFAGALAVLAAVLLFVAQYGGLRHAWDEFQAKDIAFQNTTDTALCFGDGVAPGTACVREIKTVATTHWSPPSCTGAATVTVFDPQTQSELYRRTEKCGGFDGKTIIINQRDGKFVVADSLTPSERPSASP